MNQSTLIANTFPARPRNGGRFNPDALFGSWFYQPKYNGWRLFIDLAERLVFNRHGELSSIGEHFDVAIESIRQLFLSCGIRYLDAEGLERRFEQSRGTLILLDLPESDLPFEKRMEVLTMMTTQHLVSVLPQENSVFAVPTYEEEHARRAWTGLQMYNNTWGIEFYEGLVAKKAGSEYPVTWKPTDTFKDWVKYRFDQFETRKTAVERDCPLERETQALAESQGIYGMDVMR